MGAPRTSERSAQAAMRRKENNMQSARRSRENKQRVLETLMSDLVREEARSRALAQDNRCLLQANMDLLLLNEQMAMELASLRLRVPAPAPEGHALSAVELADADRLLALE